jgi:hypothetical protein
LRTAAWALQTYLLGERVGLHRPGDDCESDVAIAVAPARDFLAAAMQPIGASPADARA